MIIRLFLVFTVFFAAFLFSLSWMTNRGFFTKQEMKRILKVVSICTVAAVSASAAISIFFLAEQL